MTDHIHSGKKIAAAFDQLQRALADIQYTITRLRLRVKSPLRLPPYKGSTLRGAFGSVFKRVICIQRQADCDDCLLRGNCVYNYVFNTPAPASNQGNNMSARVPHPFLLRPPLDMKTEYITGDFFDFDLVLIGRGIDYFPYFVYTFQRIGEVGIGRGRGRCILDEVAVRDSNGGETLLYKEPGRELLNEVLRLSPPSPPSVAYLKSVRLDFLTPVRLKSQGRFINRLTFEILIRSLLRRLADLGEYHCGSTWNIDFRTLINSAATVKTLSHDLEWRDWERYSRRQDRRMKLGGLEGSVSYAHIPAGFFPLLSAGGFLHVGKNTAFGLGHYLIKAS